MASPYETASQFQFAAQRPSNGLSVITPMYNESGGAVDLVREIHDMLIVLNAEKGSLASEIVVIDDGSSDTTVSTLMAVRHEGLCVRVIKHEQNAGQSRAVRTGVLAAKFDIIAMIDGDGQNIPADIPLLYEALINGEESLCMVAGERINRLDSDSKRLGSKLANKVRQFLLNDGARDSGCGLKLFRREAFLRLPYFDHMHRYLPFLMQREGFYVTFMPVRHRARLHGTSKYTNMGRLLVAFRDLLGVVWLKARARTPKNISEL